MDTIGDRIQAGDRVVCNSPMGRLVKGQAYRVARAFSADRKRIVTLIEMPNTEWDASRFAKAPQSPYGWFGGVPFRSLDRSHG